MIFYALLFIFTILIILGMYYRYERKRELAEEEFRESIIRLKEAWKKFTGLF